MLLCCSKPTCDLSDMNILDLIYQIKVLLTSQNIFITTLAISNLFLCIFTIPFTLFDILKIWHIQYDINMVYIHLLLSSRLNVLFIIYFILFQDILCKTKSIIEFSCLYFSSFSILLIAVDRYRIIVQPDSRQISVTMVRRCQLIMQSFLYTSSTYLYK